jgi:hypothetical protein
MDLKPVFGTHRGHYDGLFIPWSDIKGSANK